MTQRILLASSSPFRKSILDKLDLSFECASPNIDESPISDESAHDLVLRLSISKAKQLSNDYPNTLIIGSDQVACIDNQVLGKPHTHENAVNQLTNASGKAVTFLTGLCLYNSATNKHQSLVETFKVHFRKLTKEQINGYLYKEEPYKCAGSFKSEGLGITLFDRLEGKDPNSLIGLPLISLTQMLLNEGIDVLVS